MMEKYEIVTGLFYGFIPWFSESRYWCKLKLMRDGSDFVLGQEDGKTLL